MKRIIFILSVLITNMNFAYSVAISENMSNGCDAGFLSAVNGSTVLRATYEPNEHTCPVGQYLPANVDNCVACPNEYTCDGGTYYFNRTINQGIEYNTFVTQNVNYGCNTQLLKTEDTVLFAQYAPNEHVCRPGTYLPAGVDGCQPCPANHYCVGGTYTFNETNSSGATACGNGLSTPAGSSVSSQCTHVLRVGDKHIYLKTTKSTTPSLNIDTDNDGVADYFANMTTTSVPMSAEYENEISGNHLVIDIAEDYIVNEQLVFPAGLYYVYDDTITPTE